MPLGTSYALLSKLYSFTARRHSHPCSQLSGLPASFPNALLPCPFRLEWEGEGRCLSPSWEKPCWGLGTRCKPGHGLQELPPHLCAEPGRIGVASKAGNKRLGANLPSGWEAAQRCCCIIYHRRFSGAWKLLAPGSTFLEERVPPPVPSGCRARQVQIRVLGETPD